MENTWGIQSGGISGFLFRWRFVIYTLLLLPVYILRDYTPPNELKYLSIVEEALRNNTWFTFYNHGEIYADKPPLFFWMMMIPRMLTGGFHMWIMGLFSLVPAMGVLAIMDRWIRRYADGGLHAPCRLLTNVMLLTSGMFFASSLVLRMDMLMCFFITLSLYTFYKIYRSDAGPSARWLLPVWIFMALFSKGPMGFLVPVMSILVFLILQKQFKTIGRYLGWRQWLVLLGLCAMWFGAIYAEGGEEYLNNILFKQTVGRGIDSFHHKEPFWFYLKNMVMTFAPWSLAFIVLYIMGIKGRDFGGDLSRFFLTVIVANLALLSAISSKIDIYLLPIYPFVAYLGAMLLDKYRSSKWVRVMLSIPAVTLVPVLPVSFFVLEKIPYTITNPVPVYIAMAVLSATGVVALWRIWRRDAVRGALVLGGGILLGIFAASFVLPQVRCYIGFGTLATEARIEARERGIEDFFYYRFYTGPNMDVFVHHPVRYIGTPEQVDSLSRLSHETILFVKRNDVVKDHVFAEWLYGRFQPRSVYDKYSYYIFGGNRDAVPEDEDSDVSSDEAEAHSVGVMDGE